MVAGVLLLSARGGRDLAVIDRRAIGFALFTALTICAYSVIDGIGARPPGNPNGYSLWLFFGIALVMVPYALYRDGAMYYQRCNFFGVVVLPGAHAISFLRDRDLGDDDGAHRNRCGFTGDQRTIRRRNRGGGAQRAAPRCSHRRRLSDRHRLGADTPTVTLATEASAEAN